MSITFCVQNAPLVCSNVSYCCSPPSLVISTQPFAGADNFFDAGSCIDGRLTSAWNWCTKLEKKHYFHIFRLAGFVGFDGDFK